MPRTITIEQHAVFVTLADGSKYRTTDWMDWDAAIDRWTAMDDQRRDAIKAKGLVRFQGQEVKHYEVRSENDPNYRGLPLKGLIRGFQVVSREYTTEQAAAKAVLKDLGYRGHEGGWVDHEKNPRLWVAQGWFNAAANTGHRVMRLDGERGYRAVVTTMLQTKKEN